MHAITRDLNIIARCGQQFIAAMLSRHGISATQAPYILHICDKPGMSQEQLSNALHVNPSNAARQLSLLESQGYIKRNISKHDKRLIELRPTDKASSAVPIIREVNTRWNSYLTQDFDDAALASLENMLERMRILAVNMNAKDGAII